jgi:hypothetical protein
MAMWAGQSVALLPIELWDVIIRFSLPPSGLNRDSDYPWVDSPQLSKHDQELYGQWILTIDLLSQVCRYWRELLSTIRYQDLRITRGEKLSLTILLEEYARKPSLFRETYQIRVHFPIIEDISSLIAFVRGIASLTALEVMLDNGVDVSDIYKTLREHLPAILSATPSLIRLDVRHPLEFNGGAVLSTGTIGRFSDAGKYLRRLCCTLEVGPPYSSASPPSFPHLEVLRIAIRCDGETPVLHEWFRSWRLPSLKQLSLIENTLWPAWEILVLALLADNNIPNLEIFEIGVSRYYEVLSVLLTARPFPVYVHIIGAQDYWPCVSLFCQLLYLIFWSF